MESVSKINEIANFSFALSPYWDVINEPFPDERFVRARKQLLLYMGHV